MRWNKITLVGVGLLGGSLGLAVKRRKLAGQVVGYVRRQSSITECLKAKAVDVATLDLAEAVAGADLVVFCTPLAQMRSLAEQMLPALAKGTVVTDVGSVKGSAVGELEPLCRRAGSFFVGSHPMAGGDRMGVSAANAELFEEAVCVVTRTARSNPAAARRVEELWSGLGGRVLRTTVQAHDRWVARTSHLPHVLAAALATQVLDPAAAKSQSALCANGFRDTTRIASGSPEMWRDIALANRKNLSTELRRMCSTLEGFAALLRDGTPEQVEKFFRTAKQRRDKWAAKGASRSNE